MKVVTRSLPKRSKLKSEGLKASFRLERELSCSHILGIDEVGRGCLAGPVVVAGVSFSRELWESSDEWMNSIQDSKKLKPTKREELSRIIQERASIAEISFVDSTEIDRINILQATFLAARQVIDAISAHPVDMILMDGSQRIPQIKIPQHAVVAGDQISKSIAAASIVAKVARDRWMQSVEVRYPGYGFGKHKGYGTREHLIALKKLGPSPIHRLSFLKKFQAIESGILGEERAADYLLGLGFQILERNWKCPGAEIDLVALKDDQLHFFEVRYRSSVTPIEMIFPPSKQMQVKSSVEKYIFYRSKLSTQSIRIHFMSIVAEEHPQVFWDVFKF